MILRVLRGQARARELGQLIDLVRADIEDWAAIDAGLVSARAAYREAGEDLEFLLVSTWKDVESVVARGGEVTLPRGRLGASRQLREGHAQHYELMLDVTTDASRPAEVVRLSSVVLVPRRSTAFYERARKLGEELVRDAGLVWLYVGRRLDADTETAVIVTAWDNAAALDAATSEGFVGGEGIATYYASEPAIEHFDALTLEGQAHPPAQR